MDLFPLLLEGMLLEVERKKKGGAVLRPSGKSFDWVLYVVQRLFNFF